MLRKLTLKRENFIIFHYVFAYSLLLKKQENPEEVDSYRDLNLSQVSC